MKLTSNKIFSFMLAAAFALTLAGCGGGGGTAEEPPPPMPTPEEMCTDAGNHYVDGVCLTPAEVTFNTALANIAAATTAEDAQAAYDAVKDDVTATAGDMLQEAVDARVAELETMARVDAQKMALADAAGMIDTSDLSTQAAVDAARAAIAGLRGAIADAVDVDDTSMYQSILDDAIAAVDGAQDGIDTATRRTNQMDALSGASETLETALTALSGEPTQAQIDDVQTAVDGLNEAIQAGADLTDAEKASYATEVAAAESRIDQAKKTLMANNEREAEEQKQREAEEEEKRQAEEKEKAEAMAVEAAKLYAGISAPMGDLGAAGDTFAATDRTASYNVANDTDADAANGVPANSAVDTLIMVSIGDGDTAPTAAVPLSEDEDTTVDDNHGWTGKRYARTKPASDGTYEAVVYSNVEEPKEGRKFGSAAAVTDDGDYEYQLDAADRDGTANKALTIVPATHAARVSLTGVTRTAGTETFELSSGQNLITVPGMLHGVSGVFSCAPTTPADGCTAAVAAKGFTLGGGAWLFIPSDAEALVMDAPDTSYASYGWWLHKTENGKTYTASAFHDFKGTAGAVDIANLVGGTATYSGGAAGKYALSSSTGGTNDAGHFTARATLEADFEDDTITGTIDQFIGQDGESRDWEVELQEAAIADTGAITRTGANQDGNDTVWTIGGTAADASGEWSGNLREEGDDDVPKVATGTFYTEFNEDGKMVGAFGANKE